MTTAKTTTTATALSDVTATTTPTALPSLVAGPKGILVRSHPNTDPLSVMRVASNATSTTGEPLKAGESYVWESIANAANLLVCLEAAVTGAAKIEVEAV